MTMDFYYLPVSPSCRSVQMLAKTLSIDLNLKLVNLSIGEHLKPEFLKINPQHCVPTLIDDGFILWESRAILIYLAQKYGKNDNLYPKDIEKEAIVNQRLYFDMGTLYSSFVDYYFLLLFKNQPGTLENFKKCQNAFELFNGFLDRQTYAAGESLTVADFALVATVSSYEVAGFDISLYPNVEKWLNKCKETMTGYDINQAGLEYQKAMLSG